MVVVYIVFVILLPYCLFRSLHCMLTVLPSRVLLPYRSYIHVSLFRGGVMVVLLGV